MREYFPFWKIDVDCYKKCIVLKIVVTLMTFHNFIRINARMDMKFKPYDDDQRLLPPNEERSRMDSLVEEDDSNHAREMEKEHDWIANLLISHWCLIMILVCKNIVLL